MENPSLSLNQSNPLKYFFILESIILLMVFLSLSKISPIVLLAIFVLFIVTIVLPEIVLIAFVLVTLTKSWLLENLQIFTNIDYTLFLMFYIILMVSFRLAKDRNYNLPPFWNYLGPLLILCILLFIGVVYTPIVRYGIDKASRFFIFNFFLFILTILLIQERKHLLRLIILYLVGAIFFASLLIYDGIRMFISGRFLHFIVRLTVLEANPIATARILAVALVMLIIYAYYQDFTKYRNKLLLFPIFLLSIALLVTNTRGPIVSAISALIIFLVFYARMKRSKILLYLIILIGIIIGLILILPEQLTNRYFFLVGADYEKLSSVASELDTSATRLTLWMKTLNYVFSSIKNFIIGSGTGGFSSLFPFYTERLYPHNIFLEIFFELGILGLIFFSVHLAQIYKACQLISFKIQNNKNIKIIFYMVLFGSITAFITTFTSGDLPDNRYLWFFFGLIIAQWRLVNQSAEKYI